LALGVALHVSRRTRKRAGKLNPLNLRYTAAATTTLSALRNTLHPPDHLKDTHDREATQALHNTSTMATAQDEFNALFNKSSYATGKLHPEDSAATAALSDRESRSPSPAQSFLNIDDDEDEDDAEDLAVKAMRGGTYYIPRTTRQANTGPKGVIADAQAFEQARRQAQGVTAAPRRRSRMSFRRGGQQQPSPPSAYKSEDFDKSSEEDDGGDDDFMASWRERRLQELTSKNLTNVLGRSGKKVYGDLKRVDAEGFLNAVEGSPSDTVVIVLIHDHTVRFPTSFFRFRKLPWLTFRSRRSPT
jgi:hypothetical protein